LSASLPRPQGFLCQFFQNSVESTHPLCLAKYPDKSKFLVRTENRKDTLRISFGNLIAVLLACAASAAQTVCARGADSATELRLGFFPNITHAQALYARASGVFEKAIGAHIRWTAFNAGPSAIEALWANDIDATFIGPGPAINGYIKSRGEKFVIIAGAASGGSALVVRANSGIRSDKDFAGKTIATPQLGNTQDISARAWFHARGYRPTSEGGAVNLVALSNPDQLTLFKKGQIDGAWTIEPWVSRLELEAHGRVFLEEKDLWPAGKYVTTQLIVSRSFLHQHPDELRNLLRAHVEATQWLATNDHAASILNEQIRKETSRALPENVIHSALRRVVLTWDPIASSLEKDAESAYDIRFLRRPPDLTGIYDLTLLNEVLAAKGLAPVSATGPDPRSQAAGQP
jgi:NitT/TauT family transport system substrate-binding protein